MLSVLWHKSTTYNRSTDQTSQVISFSSVSWGWWKAQQSLIRLLSSPVVNWLDSLIGRGGLLSVVSHLFAVPETKLLTCGYTIANLSANMGTSAVVIGAQYCVPSTCQYTLSKANKRSKNWSVVDAANGAVIFTWWDLTRIPTDGSPNTKPNWWMRRDIL